MARRRKRRVRAGKAAFQFLLLALALTVLTASWTATMISSPYSTMLSWNTTDLRQLSRPRPGPKLGVRVLGNIR